ncbi:MAG: leucine-rich repeat domain-containing protein, partial [Muribaculaceae bacterium]|nr:leucine-rich repeat domain-containing protein [Muribaculaceae bacterium]
ENNINGAFIGSSCLSEISLNNTGEIGDNAFESSAQNSPAILTIGETVSDISSSAFYGCSGLTKITLNNNGSIAKNAFRGSCTKERASLEVAPSVGNIGEDAFKGATCLSDITLNNTGTIGIGAFQGCAQYSPAVLTIGKNVTDIYSNGFYGCDGITEITLNNTGFIAANSFQFSCTKEAATLYVNHSVTEIGQYAFSECRALQNVELMNTGNLANYAFNGCSGIRTATINNKGSLGNYSFKDCFKLEEINLQNTGSVGTNCFENCFAAESLRIAPTVTSIGNYAFKDCNKIGDITIEMVTDMDENLESDNIVVPHTLSLGSNGSNPIFSDCPLDEVYIGRKLSYNTSAAYGYSPFYRNTSLRSVEITDAETQIYDYEFYGCSNLQEVRIGDGVKSFGKYAFSGCSKIDSFEFGRSVTTIGEEAFSDCTAMTSLTSHNPVPPVCGTEALDDINKWECTLHIPIDALAAYTSAPQWQNFFFISDDITGEKIFEYEGLYYRVTNLDTYVCEVVSQNSVPAKVRPQIPTGYSDATEFNIEIPGTVINNGVIYTVKGIGDNAFDRFISLKEISIPSSVIYIGANAFSVCANLSKINVNAIVPPTVEESSFNQITYNLADLRVPVESEPEYNDHPIWSKFKGFLTEIDNSLMHELTEIARYNTNGIIVNKEYKGVVIIHYSNGVTRKVIIP